MTREPLLPTSIKTLQESLRGMPFLDGHDLLCDSIRDNVDADIAKRCETVPHVQSRIRLTTTFRAEVYAGIADIDGQKAIDQTNSDFRLAHNLIEEGRAILPTGHLFDRDANRDAKKSAKEEQLRATNALTQGMIHAMMACIEKGGSIENIPELRLLSTPRAQARVRFIEETRTTMDSLRDLMELTTNRGHLGRLYHDYCQAVVFPQNPSLTEKIRGYAQLGETVLSASWTANGSLYKQIEALKCHSPHLMK